MKSKLEIYALAVCFAAVVCLVISISIAGYSIIQIMWPELTMRSYNFDKYQTNQLYWESKQSFSKDKVSAKKPSEVELAQQRMEALRLELNGEKRNGLQSLIHALMFIVVGTITLFLHWRIAKRARL
jgi:hypothetical protein